MKESFKRTAFSKASLGMIGLCNEIIEGYQAQGLTMTLRQLYYQLVTRNVIPNQERAYKNTGRLVSDARLAGKIDWSAIEDHIRVPRLPNEFTDLKQLVRAALNSYRLPRWAGQRSYVELWVEKDALSGVLAPIAGEYHVTLMVNRGYSSQSSMYEAFQRFLKKAETQDNLILLYLGDHDPSGEDMVRDISERLQMFGAYVDVQKIALTMAQVEQYNPPPNPAKMSDSRAEGYVAKYGDQSWEVDALPPEVLQGIIREAIEERLDRPKMDKVIEQEERDKRLLTKAVAKENRQGGLI